MRETQPLSELQRAAIAASLKKMFSPGGWFSVCDFDEIVKLTGVTVSPRDRSTLALLHCQHWNALPAQVRDNALALVLSIVAADPADLSAIEETLRPKPRAEVVRAIVRRVEPQPRPNLFRRLLGGA